MSLLCPDMAQPNLNAAETLDAWCLVAAQVPTKTGNPIGMRGVARRFGVCQVTLYNWRKGLKQPTAKHCVKIEQVTMGRVPAILWTCGAPWSEPIDVSLAPILIKPRAEYGSRPPKVRAKRRAKLAAKAALKKASARVRKPAAKRAARAAAP